MLPGASGAEGTTGGVEAGVRRGDEIGGVNRRSKEEGKGAGVKELEVAEAAEEVEGWKRAEPFEAGREGVLKERVVEVGAGTGAVRGVPAGRAFITGICAGKSDAVAGRARLTSGS
jgi:hypothetical protein